MLVAVLFWNLSGWTSCHADEVTVVVPPDPAAKITTVQLRPHVEWLAGPALGGRGREHVRPVVDYLARCFRAAGLRPVFEAGRSYEQPIYTTPIQAGPPRTPGEPLPERRLGGTPLAERRLLGWNVAGRIAGADPNLADETIVIGAHIDHLGVIAGRMYPGADDNASGLSMLIETARWLAAQPTPPRRSVIFVAFDLEESGLIGSQYFVAHPPVPLSEIRLAIIADMIGRDAGGIIKPFVFVAGSEQAPPLRELLRVARREPELDVGFIGADLIGPRSDFAPFSAQQVPFLFFSTGEHQDYHTPQDTPDKVDYEKLARITRLIARLTLDASNRDELPPWQAEPDLGLDEVRSVHRVLTVVLESNVLKVASVERLMALNLQRTLETIIARGQIRKDERAWLAGICKVLLNSPR